MRARFALSTLALLSSCATLPPLHVSDPAQAVRGDHEVGGTEAAGLKLIVRAGGWRGWPADLQDRLTPIELSLQNQGGTPLRIQPALFEIDLPSGRRYSALAPGDLARVLRSYSRPEDSTLALNSGWNDLDRGAQSRGASRGYYPYAWPGLRGPAPITRETRFLGPDPRPSPEGVLEPGDQATVVLFFDVPADKVQGFIFQAQVESEAGERLGTGRVAFARQ